MAIVAGAGFGAVGCGNGDEAVSSDSTTNATGDSTARSRGDGTDGEKDGSDVTYGTPPGLVGPSPDAADHWHAAYGQGPIVQEGELATYVLGDYDVVTVAFLPAEVPLGVPPGAADRLQGNYVAPTDGGVPGVVESTT